MLDGWELVDNGGDVAECGIASDTRVEGWGGGYGGRRCGGQVSRVVEERHEGLS